VVELKSIKEIVMPRDFVKLVCTECGNENYHTTKNKKKHPEKLEQKKFCSTDRKYTTHKEKK